MFKRVQKFVETAGARYRDQSWQLALILMLWIGSLLMSSLSGPALAVTASCAWPLLWKCGAFIRRHSARRRLSAVEGVLASLACAALTWLVLGFVISEHLPIDRGDHHVMIARAELLTRALREGRIAHWSHLFQGGDSLTDLYPVFLNWLAAGIHLLMPKGTAFVDSYSWLCISAWGFRGFAAYWAGRRFSRPFPSALVAVACLFDVGAEVSDGTWHAVFYWGMIHNNIALSFGLLALAYQVDLTRRVTGPALLRCSLFVTLAAIAHPLGMLFCTTSAAAFTVATLLQAKRFRRPAWALVATALGLLLSAVWVLPYVSALSKHSFNGSVPGVEYADAGRALFNGSLPVSSFGAWVGFAFVALVCSLASARVPRFAIGLLALAFLLLALAPFLVQSRVLEWFKSYLDAQQRRCLTVVKVALVPSLAALLQYLWGRLTRRPPGVSVRAVLARALVLGLLLLGPGRAVARGLNSVKNDLHAQIPTPAPSASGKRENDTDDQHRAAFAWIKRRRAEDPSPTPWRMTFWNRFDPRMHVHWTWVQGLDTGVPLVDFGWESANFIRYRPREMTPQGMLDWNIRYVLGLSSEPEVAGFVLKHREGVYHIFEFEKYDDRFVLAPDSVHISGLRVTDGSIEFDVAGAPAAGVDVIVRCAWFPRWRGSELGRELAITGVAPHPGALPGQEQIGARVGNGHVVIRADRTMPGFFLGAATSVLGLLGGVLVIRRRARSRLELGLSRTVRTVRQAIASRWALLRGFSGWLLAGAAALVLLILGALPGARVLTEPVLEGIGLEVDAVDSDGKAHACWANALQGSYACGEDATVEAAIGITPIPDNSGEYGKFWPGMRVHVKSSPMQVILRFKRVDARAGKLRLSYTSYGSFDVTARTLYGDGPTLHVSGNSVEELALPAGLSRSSWLELRVTANAAGDLILRGEL